MAVICIARADVDNANKLLAQIESADQSTLAPEIKAAYENLKSQTNELKELDKQYKSDLEKNAKDMHDKEQSTANKIIGAAGIGLTGQGLKAALSGSAEKNIDAATEKSMKAYLETFRCSFGGGSYKGGETNIELPNAADLGTMKSEYMTLAAELKATKEALGLKPGIESEVVLDAATMGLHDDERHGIEKGAFTSVSRALLDKEGEDAEAFDKQKSDASKKTTTGATLAVVGAVGSAIASGIANKDAPKERSEEITREHEKKKEEATKKLNDAEKQLDAAIKQNQQRAKDHNEKLKQHQNFIDGTSDKECLPDGYADKIKGMTPVTEMQDTTAQTIEYDLDKIKQDYQKCVDDKSAYNDAVNNPGSNNSKKDQDTPTGDGARDPDKPNFVQTIPANDKEDCEQHEGYTWVDGQCVSTTMNDTPTSDGAASVSDAMSHGGNGASDSDDVTNPNDLTPEKLECEKKFNHVWDPIDKICQDNPPLDSNKCPKYNPEFPDIGSFHTVGSACSGQFIAIGDVVKIKEGKHAGTCTCNARACYKIGDDIKLKNGKTVRRIEVQQKTLNGITMGVCNQHIGRYETSGMCLPFYDFVTPNATTEEERKERAWRACGKKCSNTIKEQQCTNENPMVSLAYMGESQIHRNTSTYRCTCATSEEDYKKMMEERQLAEYERNTELLEAEQNYKHTCPATGGKTNASSFCDEDTFKDIQVTQLQATGLVKMYLFKKYQSKMKQSVRARFNKDLIFCSPQIKRHNNDDYLQCYDAENLENYEFRFDDVKESIDGTIKESVNRAMCKNILGLPYIEKNKDGRPVCNVTDSANCMFLEKQYFKPFMGITTSWSNARNQCTMSDGSWTKPDLKTYGGIDNTEFCDVFDMQGSSSVQNYVETYIRNFLGKQGMTPTRVRCADNVTHISPYCAGGTSDDVLRCWADGHPIDFVFDDLSEFMNYKTEGGLQAMACKAAMGTFTGKTCNGIGKEACEDLRKRNAKDCPQCASVQWDPTNKICRLPASAYAAEIDKEVGKVVVVGTALVAVVVTVATAGSSAAATIPVLVEIVGAGIEIAASDMIQQAIDDFFVESNKCHNATCAESLIRTHMARMNNLKGDASNTQVKAIDEIMEKLIGYIPDDSSLWDDVIEKAYAEKDGFFEDWEPEHFMRAFGIALQFAGVFQSIFKGAVRGFSKANNALRVRMTAVEKNLGRARGRLAKMKKGSKAYNAQADRIKQLEKQEELVQRARRGEQISDAEMADLPKSARQSVRNAASDANPHTARQIADDGAQLKKYDQLLEKERAGTLNMTEQQELNRIRNRWGHPSDEVIAEARTLSQQTAKAKELQDAEDELRKWNKWAEENPGLVKNMSNARKEEIATLRKKVSDLGGDPDAISPISKDFNVNAANNASAEANAARAADQAADAAQNAAKAESALDGMRHRSGLDDLVESAAHENSAGVRQFRKAVANEDEADIIVARLRDQGIYAGKIKRGNDYMVAIVENADDFEKMRPYIQTSRAEREAAEEAARQAAAEAERRAAEEAAEAERRAAAAAEPNGLHPDLQNFNKKKVSAKYHPDKFPEELKSEANAIQRELNNFENLSDAEKLALSKKMHVLDGKVLHSNISRDILRADEAIADMQRSINTTRRDITIATAETQISDLKKLAQRARETGATDDVARLEQQITKMEDAVKQVKNPPRPAPVDATPQNTGSTPASDAPKATSQPESAPHSSAASNNVHAPEVDSAIIQNRAFINDELGRLGTVNKMYGDQNIYISQRVPQAYAKNAVAQIQARGDFAVRLNTTGQAGGDEIVIAMTRADAEKSGYTIKNGQIIRTINNPNLANLASKVGQHLGDIRGTPVYIESISDLGVRSGRPICMVKVGERKLPFYVSSGAAGKTDVPTGKWEFFGGISTDTGWFNKGNLEDIVSHYDSPELKQIADILDSKIGDIRNTEMVLETMGRKSLGGKGSVASLANFRTIETSDVNRYMSETPSGMDVHLFYRNVIDVHKYLRNL